MSLTTQVRIYRQTFSGVGTALTMYSGTTPLYSPAEWAEASGLTMSFLWAYINTIVPSGNVPAGYTHKWKFVQWIQSGAGEPMRTEDMMSWVKSGTTSGDRLTINSIIALDKANDYPTVWYKQTYYYFDIVEITAKTYTATFVYDNGDISTTANYIFNTSFTLASPTKTNFIFSGWASNPYTEGSIGISFKWTVANNITFTAQWGQIIYTINYDRNSLANSGGGSTDQTSALSNVATIYIRPNGFTRTGYIFMGWGTDINNVNSNYIPDTYITNPKTNTTITLYAIWGLNITYSSTINSITTTTIVLKIAGSIIGTFPNYLLILNNQFPYIFKGWGYTSVDTILITSFSLVSNITLFAIWDTNNGVSFTSIQKVFGGNYPIYLSEYYLNKGLVYSPGGIGIPISGLPIKISQIIGKYKSPWMPTYFASDNSPANMDETNAIQMFNGEFSGNGTSTINVGFPFYWFNIDYGTNSNIKWDANNALTFGSESRNTWVYPLQVTTYSGIFMGYHERVLYNAIEFNSYRIGGFNVKRFIVKSSDFQEIPPNPIIIMEIILMRNSFKQHIEIKLNKWTSTTQGVWKISNGTNFYNIISKITTKLTGGSSVILSSTLTGTEWTEYNESLVLTSLSIEMLINSANLLLYLDGFDINGKQNHEFISSSIIANWVNLANTPLTATQVTIASQPLYTFAGAAFTNNKALVSNINLHNYPQMNIFIVLKKTSITNNIAKWIWTVSSEGSASATGSGMFGTLAKYGRGLYYIDNISSNGHSNFVLFVGEDAIYRFIYKLPSNRIVVLNCEYNLEGSLGKISINGVSVDFVNESCIINQSIKLYIGANTINGNTNSFTGNIHEFVVINGLLTDTERRNIYNLLYSKWNVGIFDDIIGMGKNLILRHDAKDVDGDLNYATSSKISKWYNSANATLLIPDHMSSSLLVTTQTTELKKPAYTSNSVVFTSNTGLDSTMNINSYPTLNIFVVWKQNQLPSPSSFQQLWGNSYGAHRAIIIYSGRIIRVYIGHSNINDNTQTVYGRLNNPFTTNTNLIYNVEYNLPQQPGYVFINNTKYMEFPSMYSNRSSSTSFGYSSFYSLSENGGVDASILGNIYEIIVIDKLLSDAERTNIYKLLKTKWGIIDDEPITSMGANLVLRHTARNIDGSNNSTFTSTTVYKISSWYNSANTAFTTNQTITLRQPSYTISYSDTIINNGVTFSTDTSTPGIGLLSTISIDSYPILNIFVVCKHAVFPTGTSIHLIWGGYSSSSRNLSLYNTNRIRLTYGSFSPTDVTHTLSTNNIQIYNVEYNLPEQPSKFFINNVNVLTFISSSPPVTTSTFFGSAYPGDGSRSMIGNIYEIIFIDKILSVPERTNIYNSLRSSWGS